MITEYEMLGQEGYVEIQVLQRQGKSIKAIARAMGVSRNTVRKYLGSDGPPTLPAPSFAAERLQHPLSVYNARLEDA